MYLNIFDVLICSHLYFSFFFSFFFPTQLLPLFFASGFVGEDITVMSAFNLLHLVTKSQPVALRACGLPSGWMGAACGVMCNEGPLRNGVSAAGNDVLWVALVCLNLPLNQKFYCFFFFFLWKSLDWVTFRISDFRTLGSAVWLPCPTYSLLNFIWFSSFLEKTVKLSWK